MVMFEQLLRSIQEENEKIKKRNWIEKWGQREID